MPAEQTIIIKKKRGGHGSHHGGAWKVAYADFVTAMMALFIVLWLLSTSSKKTQEGIAGYFRDPLGTAVKKGTTKDGTDTKAPIKKQDLSKLKEALLRSIHNVDNLKKLKGQIELTLTDEGLRIELIEDKKGTFFELGSAQPTPVLVELLKLLSAQLGTLPNKISIEGHTDSQPYSAGAVYTNWELSSDRANVARRLMQTSGVRKDQISQVRGFADQRLRKPDQPFDASNRRVSVIVQYMDDGGGQPAAVPFSPDQPLQVPAADPDKAVAALSPAAAGAAKIDKPSAERQKALK